MKLWVGVVLCASALLGCEDESENGEAPVAPVPEPAVEGKPEPVFPAHEAHAPEMPPPAEPEAEPEVELIEVPAFRPDGPSIVFACGRASARVPAGFSYAEWQEPCADSGYPQEIDADAIAGGSSGHTINGHGCEIDFGATDRLPSSWRPARPDSVDADSLVINTPEGTLLEISVAASAPECARFPEALVRVIHDSLDVRALRDAGTQTHAQISSAGHGITGEIPTGFWMYTEGGAADQFETAYTLRGPGETIATLYTSWDPTSDPSRPMRNFEPTLVGEGQRPVGGEVDPFSEEEECRGLGAHGPEPRILTNITFCGPPSGDAALLEVLRAMRFTRPPRRAR